MESHAFRPLVLAIDDEPSILRLIRLELSARDIEVVTAGTADEALQIMRARSPSVVLLDLVLRDRPGLDLLGEIKRGTSVPVVVVSARSEEAARLQAFELGADDFIGKPFKPSDLGDTVAFLLGKGGSESRAHGMVRSGDVEIDLRNQFVRKAGNEITLTRSEWRLLEDLARNSGSPRLSSELLTSVWGPAYQDDLEFLRGTVARLARKVGDGRIVEYFGVGYSLAGDASD